MEKLTELKRKYLLDSTDLIKRIADSMLCNIHNTVSVTELDCYIKQAISIYVTAIGYTPYYNTDLISDFDDYTLSFNSIVFGICNSDFGDYTSYIFDLVDSLFKVFSIVCNVDYYRYVLAGTPIVLDSDLDIDPFFDELLPLPLDWIEQKPEERKFTFIYRNRVFSIKNEWDFNLAFDMVIFGQSGMFEMIYRSDYSDFLVNDDALRCEFLPFSIESFKAYLQHYRGMTNPNFELKCFKELLKSYKKVTTEEIKKIQKKALNVIIPNSCL